MQLIVSNKRLLNFSGFLVCSFMMAYALYAQHGLLLEPCPLCIFQRIAVVILGCLFFIAAIHATNTSATYVYALLIGLAALGGAGVAGRHVWLQNLPPEKVPACGPGLDFMLDAFPLAEVLRMVLSGSGECAEVSWSLFGLSMPGWLLIAFTGLGIAGVIINCARAKA